MRNDWFLGWECNKVMVCSLSNGMSFFVYTCENLGAHLASASNALQAQHFRSRCQHSRTSKNGKLGVESGVLRMLRTSVNGGRGHGVMSCGVTDYHAK